MIKGVSGRSMDLDDIVSLTGLRLASNDARIYWEYVESEANWADTLSRDLEYDKFCYKHGFAVSVVPDLSIVSVLRRYIG